MADRLWSQKEFRPSQPQQSTKCTKRLIKLCAFCALCAFLWLSSVFRRAWLGAVTRGADGQRWQSFSVLRAHQRRRTVFVNFIEPLELRELLVRFILAFES